MTDDSTVGVEESMERVMGSDGAAQVHVTAQWNGESGLQRLRLERVMGSDGAAQVHVTAQWNGESGLQRLRLERVNGTSSCSQLVD